jgi:Fungal specific transcription factor domain/Fungal Zn(2)-Cys(6) binuclear cluster domain
MRHRQRFVRTRTGCLACRRRRKKCDEAKPICIGCLRNQLECTWPIDKLPHHEASQPNRESRRRGRQSEASSPGGRDYGPVQSPGISAVAGIRNEGGIDSDTDVFLSVTGTSPEDTASLQGLSPQTLEWNPETELYLGATRAPLVHSSSRLLLRHYLESTSALLAAKPMRTNPFVTLIMPLAHCDDLLMHAILALSGTHYICKYPNATDIRQSTWKHYAVVIKTLRKVQRLSVVSPEESLHLLATLMVLCHVEVR